MAPLPNNPSVDLDAETTSKLAARFSDLLRRGIRDAPQQCGISCSVLSHLRTFLRTFAAASVKRASSRPSCDYDLEPVVASVNALGFLQRPLFAR